jgi:polysaccharide pyruvyl transferase WcaK-like protein
VVFAQLLNKPVMALSHHPKVATLMADFGMSEYCLDIRKSDAELLTSTFARLVANQDEIRARMAAKVAESRQLLADQFDAMFLRQSHVREAAPSLLTTAGIGESGR